ncbi:MAG: hypothetical protein Q4C34_01105 [Bacteroidales bacterium]|nr:hypothetical protein [Bacteroidales bacterium]
MIKTGISYSQDITPALLRMLLRHPDVEIRWIAGPQLPQDGIAGLYDELKGETEPIAAVPDFEHIDLYIGGDRPELASLLDRNEGLKVIFPQSGLRPTGYGDMAVPGVAEYNRKALVRGARMAWQPDAVTMLGALALMPLAKNLLLNSTIAGTMILPADLHGSRGGMRVADMPLPSKTFDSLTADILQQLQTSFIPAFEISAIENGNSTFACALLAVDCRMSIDDITALYRDFYDDHRHIYISPDPVSEPMVAGTNKTAIHLRHDSGSRLWISVAFDAAYKTGAGNMIHLLNLLFGLDERTAF